MDLVTGGCGFIGRHLVRLLLNRGRKVRVLDIEPGDGFTSDVEMVCASVTDAGAVRKALQGVQNLYHLAGNPNLWAPDKADFETVNLIGTRIVLQEAVRCDLHRIVYTSTETILVSCKESGIKECVDETITGRPDEMPGPYCRSKFMAEQEALSAAKNGQPVIIVNPTIPIGPGDRRLTPPSRMILGFLNGKYPAYLDCTLNLIDVRDIALGHILAAEHGRIGERYILGNENMRLSAILELMEEITGTKMPRIKLPYFVALAVATIEEFIADNVTKRMPVAPLTGVRLARLPVIINCSKAIRELGLVTRPIKESLISAISWLIVKGLVQRRLPKFSMGGLSMID